MPVPAILRKTKNRVYKFTPAQIKVREATSNDQNGPSEAQLIDLAILSYNNDVMEEILAVLLKRLNDDGKNWRHILKSLTVFEFMALHGSPGVLDYCQRNKYYFEPLKVFEYFDKERHDHGVHVRNRAFRFCSIIQNQAFYDEVKEKSIDFSHRVQDGLNYNKSAIASNSYSRTDFNPSSTALPTRSYGNYPATNTIYNTNQSHNKHSPKAIQSRPVSQDIERIMPSSRDEEETQLQLALALSKEEAFKHQHNQKQAQQRSGTQASSTDQLWRENVVDNLLDLDFTSFSSSMPQSVSNQQQQLSFDPFREVQEPNQINDPFGNTSHQSHDPFRSNQQSSSQQNLFGSFQQSGPSFDPFASVQNPSTQHDNFGGFQQPTNLFEQTSNQVNDPFQIQNQPFSTQQKSIATDMFTTSVNNSQFSQTQPLFTNKPTFGGHTSTSSNQVVNDFLGEFGSKIVDMDAFESTTTYGMRQNFNKSNPFVGLEESKATPPPSIHQAANKQFDTNPGFNSAPFDPFGTSNPPLANDPFKITKTYQVNPQNPNIFNPNNQNNN